MLIDGRAIAWDILSDLKKKPAPGKTLAAILVGAHTASVSFLKQKEKTAAELGVRFILNPFPASVSEQQLEGEMLRLAYDRGVGGIILQLPLPPGFNRDRLIKLIPKEKDVDGLNGLGVLPPAAGALEEILKNLRFSMEGKRAVVVGRGVLVGVPIAAWLTQAGAHLTVTDRDDLDRVTIHSADLIVSGVGVPGIISADLVRPGAVVVDFGSGLKDGKIRGDVEYEEVSRRGAVVTPTPGGTGPIVVAKLFENFYRLCGNF